MASKKSKIILSTIIVILCLAIAGGIVAVVYTGNHRDKGSSNNTNPSESSPTSNVEKKKHTIKVLDDIKHGTVTLGDSSTKTLEVLEGESVDIYFKPDTFYEAYEYTIDDGESYVPINDAGIGKTTKVTLDNVISDFTIEGIFSEREVVITYDTDGGSTSITTQTTNYDYEFEVGVDNPTKDDYTFLYWSIGSWRGRKGDSFYNWDEIQSNLTGNEGDSAYSFTVKATYISNGATINVNYDVNGGDVAAITSTTVSPSSSISSMTSTIPTRTDHKFLGWYTESDAGTNRIKDGSIWESIALFVDVSDTTPALNLYAHWLDENNTSVTLGSLPQTQLDPVVDEELIGLLEDHIGLYDSEEEPDSPLDPDVVESAEYQNLPTAGGTVFDGYDGLYKDGAWISSTYVYGDGEGNAIDTVDFMWYQDVTYTNAEEPSYDGKYRAVYFDKYLPNVTTLVWEETNTYQKSNGYETGVVYWFAWEDLTWTVLDSSSGLAIADNVIDSRYFCEETIDREVSDNGVSYHANDYTVSTLEAMFRLYYLDWAFTDEELDSIYTAQIDNGASSTNSNTNQYGTENLYASMFALSYAEYTNDLYFADDASRSAEATDYAKCDGIYHDPVMTGYNAKQWTRSADHSSSSTVSIVDIDGSLDVAAVNLSSIGIRPALFLKS